MRAKTIISGQPIGRCFIHLLKVIYPIFVRFQKRFPNRPIEAFIDGVLLRAIRMSIKANNVFVPRRTGKFALKFRPVVVSIVCVGANKNASIPRNTCADERALLDENIMAKPIREYRSIAVIAYPRLP